MRVASSFDSLHRRKSVICLSHSRVRMFGACVSRVGLRVRPRPVLRLSSRNTVIVKRVNKPPLVTIPCTLPFYQFFSVGTDSLDTYVPVPYTSFARYESKSGSKFKLFLL